METIKDGVVSRHWKASPAQLEAKIIEIFYACMLRCPFVMTLEISR